MTADSSLVALEKRIREAKAVASRLSPKTRDKVLGAFKEGLLLHNAKILQANRADVEVRVQPLHPAQCSYCSRLNESTVHLMLLFMPIQMHLCTNSGFSSAGSHEQRHCRPSPP